MNINDILNETPADDISQELSQLGFNDIRLDSSRTVTLYVPAAERMNTIQHLVDKLPNAEWDRSAPGSSIGAVRYKNTTIKIKPQGKSGSSSAGLDNEDQFVETIEQLIQKNNGSIDITFKGNNGTSWNVKGVTKAKGVGADTAGRKKADVVLETQNGLFNISLKKSNAEYWESADTYFGHEADKIIERLLEKGELELLPLDKTNSQGNQFVKLNREIAVKASEKETQDVIFGSDLLGKNGAVIKQTFSPGDFSVNGNQVTITCDAVIVEPSDIPENQEVYFLIRNDSTRGRPRYKYPGIRATAIYKKRLGNGTLIVTRK